MKCRAATEPATAFDPIPETGEVYYGCLRCSQAFSYTELVHGRIPEHDRGKCLACNESADTCVCVLTRDVYDNEIRPLLRQAMDLCEKHGIPLIAVVDIVDATEESVSHIHGFISTHEISGGAVEHLVAAYEDYGDEY